jgi:hypothetical protein
LAGRLIGGGVGWWVDGAEDAGVLLGLLQDFLALLCVLLNFSFSEIEKLHVLAQLQRPATSDCPHYGSTTDNSFATKSHPILSCSEYERLNRPRPYLKAKISRAAPSSNDSIAAPPFDRWPIRSKIRRNAHTMPISGRSTQILATRKFKSRVSCRIEYT